MMKGSCSIPSLAGIIYYAGLERPPFHTGSLLLLALFENPSELTL
jgi:hypothetical protein